MELDSNVDARTDIRARMSSSAPMHFFVPLVETYVAFSARFAFLMPRRACWMVLIVTFIDYNNRMLSMMIIEM